MVVILYENTSCKLYVQGKRSKKDEAKEKLGELIAEKRQGCRNNEHNMEE